VLHTRLRLRRCDTWGKQQANKEAHTQYGGLFKWQLNTCSDMSQQWRIASTESGGSCRFGYPGKGCAGEGLPHPAVVAACSLLPSTCSTQHIALQAGGGGTLHPSPASFLAALLPLLLLLNRSAPAVRAASSACSSWGGVAPGSGLHSTHNTPGQSGESREQGG
jgi:hypothetical protein